MLHRHIEALLDHAILGVDVATRTYNSLGATRSVKARATFPLEPFV